MPDVQMNVMHHYLFEDVPFPLNNGDIIHVSKIIKAVMSYAVEVEIGS